MRNIIVSKFGNEPNPFDRGIRYGMLGEWECLKLMKILSEDKDNLVTYFGRAIWDKQKASEYFNNPVWYIEASDNTDTRAMARMAPVDEFHIVLGPHSFYNGGDNIPAWESIKTSLVTKRLLERVAPQIKLMNANPDATCYFYLSDRRFVLQAADLTNKNVKVYGQTMKIDSYDCFSFCGKDFTLQDHKSRNVWPFRFETLWLYEKNYQDYLDNVHNTDKQYKLIIPANQVTSDSEIDNSRLSKIMEFTNKISNFVTVGQWTNQSAIKQIQDRSTEPQYLHGLNNANYINMLKKSEYALVLFNTQDSPCMFKNNWLTVKYWECVFNGCLTFVEGLVPDFPRELQVFSGNELADKLQRCEVDLIYKNKLLEIQNNLVLPEYFTGTYYTNWIEKEREDRRRDN